MTRSSQEIEREVEATREGLDRTLDALKDKMTPGQLIDELTSSLKGSGASDIFANLGTQVRDNPLALAMVGAGLAWLMSGKGSGHAGREAQSYSSADGLAYEGPVGSYDGGQDGTGLKDKASDLVSNASDKIGQVKDRVTQTAEHALHGLSDAAGHAKHGAQNLGGQAAHAGQTIQRSFQNTLESEPLIVGAIGLAVGMAVGAALPATAIEDRTFGGLRDEALEKGKAAGEHVLGDAKHAASAALQGVKEEADRQGLLGSEDGGSLVEKAESVIRAGVEAGRDEIEGRAH